ncbi:hypothetical protein CRUP_012746 [Coryphaenoides rupestris]|nr:hypothetical protein CRUP_012746 [Coryphaenoides rupestris]
MAPPHNMPANIPGYENMLTGGTGGFLPPPMPMEPVAPTAPPPDQDWSIPCISEEACREAFKEYAASNCCYSKSPAADGVITSMEPLNTFRTAPRPWEIQATPPNLFTNHTEEIRVPYTSTIKTAPRPWEIQATPPNLFTNHTEEIRVPYTSTIKVYPLLGFPDQAISQASERLVRDHQAKFPQTSRILQQRQTVELIPVAKVSYKWKGDAHSYYVSGNEHRVTADYPDTCCCLLL